MLITIVLSETDNMSKILKQYPGVLDKGDYTSTSCTPAQARLLFAISFLGLPTARFEIPALHCEKSLGSYFEAVTYATRLLTSFQRPAGKLSSLGLESALSHVIMSTAVSIRKSKTSVEDPSHVLKCHYNVTCKVVQPL